MKYLQRAIYSILVMLLSVAAIGQNNTTSPYSVFGIGELSSIAYGRNLALGGSGFGIRSSKYLNLKNPASLTAIDSLSFLFETGFHLKSTLSQSTYDNNLFTDGNMTHLIMGNRINSNIMMSLGMMPYSSVGYRLKSDISVDGVDGEARSYWKELVVYRSFICRWAD